MSNVFRDKDFLKINKTVNLSIFVSIAILLGILESFIPINFVVPGIKIGLGNIVLLIIFPYYSFRELLFFQFARITISTFILGLFSIYIFSILAGITALLIMYFCYKLFQGIISVYTLSIIGAVTHNITQLIVAMYMINSFVIINYAFFLVITGVVMGLITGYIVDKKLYKIRDLINYDSIKKLFS